MNRVLSILILLCAFVATTMAVDYQTYKPQSQQYQGAVYSTAEAAQGNVQNTQNATFSSTSAYSKQLEENASRPVNPMVNVQTERVYTIPVAATGITGGVTTEDGRVIHRISRPEDDPTDPDPAPDMPIGDTPWLWMALLALGYAAFRVYHVRNSDAKE